MARIAIMRCTAIIGALLSALVARSAFADDPRIAGSGWSDKVEMKAHPDPEAAQQKEQDWLEKRAGTHKWDLDAETASLARKKKIGVVLMSVGIAPTIAGIALFATAAAKKEEWDRENEDCTGHAFPCLTPEPFYYLGGGVLLAAATGIEIAGMVLFSKGSQSPGVRLSLAPRLGSGGFLGSAVDGAVLGVSATF